MLRFLSHFDHHQYLLLGMVQTSFFFLFKLYVRWTYYCIDHCILLSSFIYLVSFSIFHPHHHHSATGPFIYFFDRICLLFDMCAHLILVLKFDIKKERKYFFHHYRTMVHNTHTHIPNKYNQPTDKPILHQPMNLVMANWRTRTEEQGTLVEIKKQVCLEWRPPLPPPSPLFEGICAQSHSLTEFIFSLYCEWSLRRKNNKWIRFDDHRTQRETEKR